MGVGASYNQFLYREYSANQQKLNQEKGGLPGLSLNAGYQFDNDITLSVDAELFSGDADYLGQTNFAVPLSTQTDERFARYRFSAELPLSDWLALSMPLRWNNQLRWSQWRRDIQASGRVSGLFEEYTWGQVSTGLAWPFLRRDKWSVALAVDALYTLSPEINVDLRPLGYAAVSLSLGEEPGWRAALNGRYLLPGQWSVAGDISYEQWQFGKSETVLAKGRFSNARITEPRSESSLFAINIYLRKSF